MRSLLGAAVFSLLAASLARAHFPFIVPDATGDAAKVVFSDTLEPDTKVNIEKLSATKLTVRVDGKESALDWKKGEGFYTLSVPGSGNRLVYGVTEYGVLQKGDSKPFKLVYFPKAVLGNPNAPECVIGEKCPLEIVFVGEPGKAKFRVLSFGKPVPESEVTVLLPDGSKKAVTTDKDGCTPVIESSGRLGVYARLTEVKSGEFAGKKYEEIRNYATLVCEIK